MPAFSDDELDLLADRIAMTAASIDAACHHLLVDLRRFDRERGWARQGFTSCAHWLNWRCGISLSAAREKVRVAHALAGLPRISEALAQGQLSYSKVRALTRVATPAQEARLVDAALHTTASQLERTCRLLGQMGPPPAASAPPPARWVRVRDTDDGLVRIEVQLRPEEAARVMRAIDASAESRPDGVVALAEAALRGDRPDRPPVEVLVHIDAGTLTGSAGDTGVGARTAERLLCDAGVVPVLTGESGATIDVGRKTRVISGALRRALVARDGGCRFPGCTHRRFVDGHHIRHWARGGETSLRNTLILCTAHHRLVHEGGFRVEGHGADPRFIAPDGREVAPVGAPPPRVSRVADVAEPAPVWDGDRVDVEALVASLA